MIHQEQVIEYLEKCLEVSQRKVLSHFQSKQVNEYFKEHSTSTLDFESDTPKFEWQEEINLLFKYWIEEFLFRLTMHVASTTEAEEIQHGTYVDFTTSESFASKMGTMSGDKYQRQIFSLQQKLYLMEKQNEKLQEEIEKQEILLINRQNKMETIRKEHLLIIHGLSRDLDSIVNSNEQYSQYFDTVVREIENAHKNANDQFLETETILQNNLDNDKNINIFKHYNDQKKAFRKIFRKENTILSMLKEKTQFLLQEAKKIKKRHNGTEINNIVAKSRIVSKNNELNKEDVIRLVSFTESKNVECQTNAVVVWEKDDPNARTSARRHVIKKETVINQVQENGINNSTNLQDIKDTQDTQDSIATLQLIINCQRMKLEDCYSRLNFIETILPETVITLNTSTSSENLKNLSYSDAETVSIQTYPTSPNIIEDENEKIFSPISKEKSSPRKEIIESSVLEKPSQKQGGPLRSKIKNQRKSIHSLLHHSPYATKPTVSQGSNAEKLLEQLVSLSNEIDDYINSNEEIEPFHYTNSEVKISETNSTRKSKPPSGSSSARRTSIENKAELIHMSDIANITLMPSPHDSINAIMPFEYVSPIRENELNKFHDQILNVSKKPVTRKKPVPSGPITKNVKRELQSRDSPKAHSSKLPLMKSFTPLTLKTPITPISPITPTTPMTPIHAPISHVNTVEQPQKKPVLKIDLERAYRLNGNSLSKLPPPTGTPSTAPRTYINIS